MTSSTCAFWLRIIQVIRLRPLTLSRTSGQSRRTSVTSRPPAETVAAPGGGLAAVVGRTAGSAAGPHPGRSCAPRAAAGVAGCSSACCAFAGCGRGGCATAAGRRRGLGRLGAAQAVRARLVRALAGCGIVGRRPRGGHLPVGSPGGGCGRHLAAGQPLFDALEPGREAQRGVVGGREQQPGADQFELQARRNRPAHQQQAVVHGLRRPRRLHAAEPGRLRVEPFGDLRCDLDQPVAGSFGIGRDDDQVTKPVQEVFGEAPWILAGLHHLVDDREHARTVVGGERVDDLVEQRLGRVAEQ